MNQTLLNTSGFSFVNGIVIICLPHTWSRMTRLRKTRHPWALMVKPFDSLCQLFSRARNIHVYYPPDIKCFF